MRFLTAGESHGKELTVILEGFPKGFRIEERRIQQDLLSRKQGFGRGPRMKLEPEKVAVLSGIRNSVSMGSPIALRIENKDWRIFPFGKDRELPMSIPRPAHADLAGMLKYQTYDARDILERASARETAARVAVGSVCTQALREFSIESIGYVRQIGTVRAEHIPPDFQTLKKAVVNSGLRCPDAAKEKEMIAEIERARQDKDTLGGAFEVRMRGVPAGLGSCMHWDKRLDAQLACQVASIPAVKALEIGAGCSYALARGSRMHDAIKYSKQKGFYHTSNNSGGIEGGMSNGEDILIRGYMKPIPTLMQPIDSIDAVTKKQARAPRERSDTAAVSSCSVVAENVCAFVILDALLEKFGHDTRHEIEKSYNNYLACIKKY